MQILFIQYFNYFFKYSVITNKFGFLNFILSKLWEKWKFKEKSIEFIVYYMLCIP